MLKKSKRLPWERGIHERTQDVRKCGGGGGAQLKEAKTKCTAPENKKETLRTSRLFYVGQQHNSGQRFSCLGWPG